MGLLGFTWARPMRLRLTRVLLEEESREFSRLHKSTENYTGSTHVIWATRVNLYGFNPCNVLDLCILIQFTRGPTISID